MAVYRGGYRKKKGPAAPFFFNGKQLYLLVVDVHRHFEAEADVIESRGFPFHVCNLRCDLKA